MQIAWDASECAHKTKGKRDEDMVNKLAALSSQVGLNEITNDNYFEWVFRILFLKQAGTCDVASDFTALPGIVVWTGLKTNAKDMTREQFMSRVAKAMERDVEDSMRRRPGDTRN
jgi:hypothetical protein